MRQRSTWMKENTHSRQKFQCKSHLPPSPLQPSPLKPYQYFERRESIYMILYFPTLSSAGNPRASPKETNAPASISQLLILLTRRRSPTHSFAQSAAESVCTYSTCLRARAVRLCAAWALALHGHLMCRRVKDACMQAAVCIRGCPCNFSVQALSERTCLILFVCRCVILMVYRSDFPATAPLDVSKGVVFGEMC